MDSVSPSGHREHEDLGSEGEGEGEEGRDGAGSCLHWAEGAGDVPPEAGSALPNSTPTHGALKGGAEWVGSFSRAECSDQ